METASHLVKEWVTGFILTFPAEGEDCQCGQILIKLNQGKYINIHVDGYSVMDGLSSRFNSLKNMQ